MKSQQKKYRRIRMLFADDLSENVENLLEGLIASGLLRDDLNKQLSLESVDIPEVMQDNYRVLHHPGCLIEVDYATLMHQAMEKIRRAEAPYDLVISDWYFGEYDPEYKDSQIGGIWIMLWGQLRKDNYKPICKLYTGQQSSHEQQGIDFKLAREYIKSAFGIEIKVLRKSETAESWRDHLGDFLLEVAKNIVSQIKTNDLVAVINYIQESLAYNKFNNIIQDNGFEAIKEKLEKLNDFELCLVNGDCIRLIHLFPYHLGRYLLKDGKFSFAKMEPKEIEAVLYSSRRLEFYESDEGDEKFEQLKATGIACDYTREFDRSGNPIYVINIKSESYEKGIFSEIKTIFSQALDYTFKVQTFYLNERGLSKLLHSKNIPLGQDMFDNIREITILPEFEAIKTCFEKTPVTLKDDLPSLADQIHEVLKRINEENVDGKSIQSEKQLDEKFSRLQRQPLFEPNSKNLLIPLKNLFRINVYRFLTDVLKLEPLPRNLQNYAGYEPLGSKDFYWYCNAWLVREGLRTIASNMQGEEKYFMILKPKGYLTQAVIRYKIILRDSGVGLSSIARAFMPDRGHFSNVGKFLQGFCEFTVRSKMDGQEGIGYRVFLDTTDATCSKLKLPGTEFEMIITQSRDR